MKKSIGVATLVGVICLALTPIAPAYAANWVYVAKNTNGAVFYYDSDTIRRSGNQWVDVRGQSALQLVQTLRELDLDILVDLKLTPSVLDIIAPRFLPALILQLIISPVSSTLVGTAWIHPSLPSAIRWDMPLLCDTKSCASN